MTETTVEGMESLDVFGARARRVDRSDAPARR